MQRLYWIFGLVAAVLVWLCLDQRGDVRLQQADGSFSYPSYSIKPLEPFQLRGRVLSTHEYRSGREAELSPVDLAMGWGQMADPDNIAQVEISQLNRWFFWRAQSLPLPRSLMESSMANIHIIPATAEVAEQVQSLAAGTMVRLTGDLVQVNAADGWRWRSSLSRTDTGANSCELLWLKSVEEV